jgi:hypothetical protein
VPPPPAETLYLGRVVNYESQDQERAHRAFFLRASLGVPPFGRVPGLSERRLPFGQNQNLSVFSVPLWLERKVGIAHRSNYLF